MHLFSRLRYTMQRLSEGLAGILLVVRHLFHKTGFKLHVRGKHGGRTIDEEGMISIAFDLTSVIRKTSCESSGWHHVKLPNCASSLGAGGVHKTWLSRHLTDSKSGCPGYPPMGKEVGGSNVGLLRDPVTWYGICYAGTQVKQRDIQSKGIRTRPARLSFVLKVSLCNLRPSIISSVVRRAHNSLFSLWNAPAGNHGSCIHHFGTGNTTTMIPCRRILDRIGLHPCPIHPTWVDPSEEL